MTGYEVHCICMRIMQRRIVPLQNYLKSTASKYFEKLAKYFVSQGLNKDDVQNYIICTYKDDPISFSAYTLMSEKSKELFTNWKKELSTPALYLQHVSDGFNYIENFCLKHELSFEEYCNRFLIQHIRKNKVDFVIAVYMKLFNKDTLTKLEKILLKKYFKDYSIIELRIQDPELNTVLKQRSKEMMDMIRNYNTYKKPTNKYTQVHNQ
jgi:hypothetical protein